jgi:hypothetical protein
VTPARRARMAALLAEFLELLAARDACVDAAELLALDAAADTAKCSMRTIRAAIRGGDLPAYGRQRSRAVRRADLDAWITSRRVRPIAGHDDPEMARRMRRIAAGRRCQ